MYIYHMFYGLFYDIYNLIKLQDISMTIGHQLYSFKLSIESASGSTNYTHTKNVTQQQRVEHTMCPMWDRKKNHVHF